MKNQTAFSTRFARHKDELEWLFMELYHNREGLEVLEREMLGVRGVTGACVVGIPDPRLGQAIVAAYTGPATPGEVIEGLDHLPRWQLPKELKRLVELPVTGPGKVDRRGVEKLF